MIAATVCCMAGAGFGKSGSNAQDVDDDIDGFAVAVVRDESGWKVTALKPSALSDLEDAERQLLELRSAGAVFGLLDVDDEFFIVVRPAPAGARLLLSDATAAIAVSTTTTPAPPGSRPRSAPWPRSSPSAAPPAGPRPRWSAG